MDSSAVAAQFFTLSSLEQRKTSSMTPSTELETVVKRGVEAYPKRESSQL
jgi:hypothetical protein